MKNNITPINKLRLTDNLAQNISEYINNNSYSPGDRLPSITELSRLFGVGQPTLREAIKQLETYGVVDVKHGSGIYVSDGHDRMFFSNPIALNNIPTRTLLINLIEARLSVELRTVSLASKNIKQENIDRMEAFLKTARENLDNDEILNRTNMSFHLEIAAASGNVVLRQLLGMLLSLYRNEQQLLLHVYSSKERDHNQHIEIFNALRERNEKLALERMEQHLSGVRKSIEKWKPDDENT